MSGERATLSGWGRTAASTANLVRPDSLDACATSLDTPPSRGSSPVVSVAATATPRRTRAAASSKTTAVAGIHDLDIDRGVVTAEAGVSLEALMRWLVPLGWFVPVSPGHPSRHGRRGDRERHPRQEPSRVGSWCNHVVGLDDGHAGTGQGTRDARAATPTCSGPRPAAWASPGVVLDATIQLKPIETSVLMRRHRPCRATSTTVMALMEAGDSDYDYSVAWIDLMATGACAWAARCSTGAGSPASTSSTGDSAGPARYSGRVCCATAPPIVPAGTAQPRVDPAVQRDRGTARRRVAGGGALQTHHRRSSSRSTWCATGTGSTARRGFLQYQFVVPVRRRGHGAPCGRAPSAREAARRSSRC